MYQLQMQDEGPVWKTSYFEYNTYAPSICLTWAKLTDDYLSRSDCLEFSTFVIHTVFDLISEHALISGSLFLKKKKIFLFFEIFFFRGGGSLIRAIFWAQNYVSGQSAN